MFKIYLARHGQDEDNAAGILNGHRDTKLTDIGIEQAKIFAQKIKDSDLNIVKVYSSPLLRAYKTAEIVTEILNIEKPEKETLLIERDFGVMTGKQVNSIEKLCSPDILKADPITYFLSPKDAETFPDLIIRAKKMIEIVKNNKFNGIVAFERFKT